MDYKNCLLRLGKEFSIEGKTRHHAMENYPRIGWVRDASRSREADIANIVKRILSDRQESSDIVAIEGKIQKGEMENESKPQVRQGIAPIQEKNMEKIDISPKVYADSSIINFSGSFRLDLMKSSALEETANIILSSGITSLTYIVENGVIPGMPSYSFCKNYNSLHDKITRDGQMSVFFDIWSSCVSGCVAIKMPAEFLTKAYNDLLEYSSLESLGIHSPEEENVFRESIPIELGNIFAGTCSTSIANCTHTTVRVSQSDFSSVEDLFNSSTPIYVAMLPFKLKGVVRPRPSLMTYLFLDIESLKAILYTDDTYSSPFDKPRRILKPSHWIK